MSSELANVHDEPCWRCSLLNVPCRNPSEVRIPSKARIRTLRPRRSQRGRKSHAVQCIECRKSESSLPCIRKGDLLENFDLAFDVITEVDFGVWVGKDWDNPYWEIKLDFGSFTSEQISRHVVLEYAKICEIVELETPRNKKTGEVLLDEDAEKFKEVEKYMRFITQFCSFDARWMHQYGRNAHDLIRMATRLHAYNYLGPENKTIGDGDVCPILSTLRCLAVTHDFTILDYSMPHKYSAWSRDERFDFQELHVADPEIEDFFNNRHNLIPQIDIRRMPMTYKPPTARMSNLSYLLKQALRRTQDLLLQGDPRHFPTVLFTLVLMSIILHDIECAAAKTEFFSEVYDAVSGLVIQLAGLFLYCSDDMHPFHEEFDLEWFSVTVGGDPIVVESYKTLHRIWKFNRDSRTLPPKSPTKFMDCLEDLTVGP